MGKVTAVIGMGLMGAAIAARLCATERAVIVWNRTASKCRPLADMGARVAETARDAVNAADTVILVTTKTEDVAGLFDSTSNQLSGKDVVNLITGSPRQIRELGELVTKAGAAYLIGTIQCYPSDIGGEHAVIVLGGSPDAWERQEQLIRAIAGAAAYLGAKVEMPNIVDAGSTGGFFFSAMGACLEAVAYAGREGVDVAAYRPFIRQALKLLPAQLDLILDAVEEQQFGTVEATIHTFSNSLDKFRAAYADVGAPDLLLAANHRRMREAIAGGMATTASPRSANTNQQPFCEPPIHRSVRAG